MPPHSVAFAVVLGAGITSTFFRDQPRTARVRLAVVPAITTISHGLLDAWSTIGRRSLLGTVLVDGLRLGTREFFAALCRFRDASTFNFLGGR